MRRGDGPEAEGPGRPYVTALLRRHLSLSPRRRVRPPARRSSGGWTLLEMVITLTVLSILTLAAVPMVQNSVQRQRETRLREALRQMREAIKEFHRDTIGMQCAGAAAATTPQQQQQQQLMVIDPRSRVVITDCTIFTADNPDRYPPSLEALVDGVNVIAREAAASALSGSTPSSGITATENPLLATKKKVYLREIPIDPMTGRRDTWEVRSSYDGADAGSWGGENVFDVRSGARGTALNGERYSDW